MVLVGNKIDLREEDESTARNLEEAIMPMMVRFREVETCVECSAKELVNLSEVCVCLCVCMCVCVYL